MPVTFFGYNFDAIALGIAREALEGLIELATRKTSPATGAPKDSGEARYAASRSQAVLDAHRRHPRESFAPIWKNMQQHHQPTASSCGPAPGGPTWPRWKPQHRNASCTATGPPAAPPCFVGTFRTFLARGVHVSRHHMIRHWKRV